MIGYPSVARAWLPRELFMTLSFLSKEVIYFSPERPAGNNDKS
jgi:hypothetical protein